MWKKYADTLIDFIEEIKSNQHVQINKAATLVADTITAEGLIHTFGTGHSALVAQEIFMRAGGIVQVNAILDPSFLPSTGAMRSNALERMPGAARIALNNHDVRPDDIAVIISNSGKNPAPVEMALEMKKRGLKVIAITSLKHSKSVESGHESGQKLFQIADVVLDNLAPPGDATLQIAGVSAPVGPVSGVLGSFLIQAVVVEAVEILSKLDTPPPVFFSANIDTKGVKDLGQAVNKYKNRIKHI